MTPQKETIKATLTIYRNLPWSMKLLHQDADGKPINLTGYQAKLVVRDKIDPVGTILKTFTTTDGSIILTNGVIELKIPTAAEVNAFTWNSGFGHLVLQAPADVPRVQALFAFVIQTSTTDAP